MVKEVIKTIEIHSGVSPDFLENTLTPDITVLESLFDLIDNSIDAARNHLISNNFEKDRFGLPDNYSNYMISIRLSKNSISILDNCLGIEEENLTNRVFMTADISNHKFGIGHYGLGLKRALLKFGNKYAMSSDNGKIAFKLRFDTAMIAGNKSFKANAYNSSGYRKTLFIVSDIKTEIAYEISSKDWFENAVKKLSIRYAEYITKGLKLNISNNIHAEFKNIIGALPKLREDAKYKPIIEHIKIDGVDVFIEAGIHKLYHFPIEGDKYSISENKKITDDFGLYFVCNDRIIVSSSTEKEHGWKTKWHSEYNGFVCIVRFVSEDSGKMPWNTLKTALKTDSSMFVKVRNKIQPIADAYRRDVKKIYLNKSQNGSSEEDDTNFSKTANSTSSTNNTADANSIGNKKAPKNIAHEDARKQKTSHVRDWSTVLPEHFPVSNNDILDAYIIEAKNLKLYDAPCASAMLLRSLLEKSLKEFIIKSNNYRAVKDYYYNTSEGKKKNHTEIEKNHQEIASAMIFPWLLQSDIAIQVFGIQEKQRMTIACKKASTHTKKLNGIVHGNEFIDNMQISNIRNEIYPLLDFCVKYKKIDIQ